MTKGMQFTLRWQDDRTKSTSKRPRWLYLLLLTALLVVDVLLLIDGTDKLRERLVEGADRHSILG